MDNERGYSLIELIVSIALVGILMIMISSFFISDVRNTERLSDENELQYQAQVVNDYLVNRISQSRSISIDDSYDMITIDSYLPDPSKNNQWKYQTKRIMHKANGDIFEEGSELAVYVKSMDFSLDSKDLVHYRIVFEKGRASSVLENSVLMRNAVN